MLVENGAKVDLQTGAGSGNATALVLAAEQGHLGVVKALVELGAAPDVKGNYYLIHCILMKINFKRCFLSSSWPLKRPQRPGESSGQTNGNSDISGSV